jgi:hypothetical protein
MLGFCFGGCPSTAAAAAATPAMMSRKVWQFIILRFLVLVELERGEINVGDVTRKSQRPDSRHVEQSERQFEDSMNTYSSRNMGAHGWGVTAGGAARR